MQGNIQVSGLTIRQIDDRRKSSVPVTSWKWKREGGDTTERQDRALTWMEQNVLKETQGQSHQAPQAEGLWAWSNALLAILRFTIILSVNLGLGACSWADRSMQHVCPPFLTAPFPQSVWNAPGALNSSAHQAWQFSEIQNEYKRSVSWKLGALNLFERQNSLLLFHINRTTTD